MAAQDRAAIFAQIDANINANANEEITGPILNGILKLLVDSAYNLIDEANVVEIGEYNPLTIYNANDNQAGVFYNGNLYQAKTGVTNITGSFDSADWNLRSFVGIDPGSASRLSYDPATGLLSLTALGITSVTVDNSSADLATWITANYTGGNELQEGDTLILQVPMEAYIHNGGTAGDATDFSVLQVPNLSDTYVRNLFSGSGGGLSYNPATGAFTQAEFTGIGSVGSVPDPGAGTATRVLRSDGSWSEASSTFDGLTDTPANKTGSGNYFTRVNAGETALEYVASSSINLSSFNNDAGFVAGNIYTTNGTLSGARTVTMSGNTITWNDGRSDFVGNGATSATFTAKFHNSTGTNNSVVIRDDGRTGFGTDTPLARIHSNGAGNSTSTTNQIWTNSDGDELGRFYDNGTLNLGTPGGAPDWVLGIDRGEAIGTIAGPQIAFEAGGARWSIDIDQFGTNYLDMVFDTVNNRNFGWGDRSLGGQSWMRLTSSPNGQRLGLGLNLNPDAVFQISGDNSLPVWSLNGAGFRIDAASYNDNITAASTTVATTAIHSMAAPTLTSTNGGSGTEVTFTDAATLYIESGPQATLNNTLVTNAYGIWVANDGLRIDNKTTTGATAGADTLPANPVGFLTLNLDGTNRKVPYYAL